MRDWFIVTLVTHSSGGWAVRGWAEVSTTSASIRWIWPDYMYPDESSRVLVYWLKGHNLLGWCMYIGLWKYICLHDKTNFGFSLPFCCLLYVLWCGFFFLLQWSSTCWCEQRWELPLIIGVMEVLLHSLLGLDIGLLGLFFKAMARVYRWSLGLKF